MPILPSSAIDWKIWKPLYLHGWFVRRSVVCHAGVSSVVNLAFADAQVMPLLSREETENTDDTDGRDDTDDTDDTEDTDDTDDTDDPDDTDDTDDKDDTDKTDFMRTGIG